MREILFRGKRKDSGEWVFGCYYKQLEFYGDEVDDHIIITSLEDLSFDQALEYCDVQAETVGQFTGLIDRNGRKIFEGDIIKHYNDVAQPELFEIGMVWWDDCRMCFKRTSKPGSVFVWRDCIYEVIGNKYDNPELLEGGAS